MPPVYHVAAPPRSGSDLRSSPRGASVAAPMPGVRPAAHDRLVTELSVPRTRVPERVQEIEAFEVDLDVAAVLGHHRLLPALARAVAKELDATMFPIRLAVTSTTASGYRCELGVLAGLSTRRGRQMSSIFNLRQRQGEDTSSFVTVFVVPTGIGSAIGGHAGDATPAAQLLAAVSDTLVTHPNVVNASDVNELPANALYVEGSVLARLLLGTAGLERVRANRVLVVADAHPDPLFADQLVNAVNAARSSFGLSCPGVVFLDPPLPTESVYAASGRATGHVRELERLFAVLDAQSPEYDAIALSTLIGVDPSMRSDYYDSEGEVINPWGGAEAILTHAVCALYGVPAAHSPMLESREVAGLELGVVDPRMAAEVISSTFFISVLKGLQRSPRIVPVTGPSPGVLTAEQVSCLVQPVSALGLPTLAALEQGIPVIAVRESENLMDNDLGALPWGGGKLYVVDNYWEAAGVLACLRAGIDPSSVRRPLERVPVEIFSA
jgi:hypothetical protein